MIPLYMPDAVVGADVDRRRLVLPGSKEWDLPSIRAGLLFAAPFTKSTAPVHSAAGTTGLSTETVSALGTRARETDDYIVQAIANQARFTKYGMVSEVARENILVRSNELGTGWTNTHEVLTQNGVDPAGVANSAWTITDSASDVSGATYKGITVPDDALTRVMSVYIEKQVSADACAVVRFRYSGGTGAPSAVYLNAQTGAIGVANGETPTAYGVIDEGTRWRLWTAMANNESGNTTLYAEIRAAGSTVGSPATFAAAAVGSKIVSFFQVEVGSAPSTYIPTAASSVVRAAEDLDIAGGNASIAAGTLMTAVTLDGLHGVNQYICDIYVDATNHISLYVDTAGKPALLVDAGGEQALLTATSALTVGTTAVITAAWAANDVRLYVNGADEQADTSATMPSGSPTVFIGQDGGNATQLMGSLQRLCIWNRAPSAAEIAFVYHRDYQRWKVA